jgi:hypothetical protein
MSGQLSYCIKRVGWAVRMCALTGPWQPLLLSYCRAFRQRPPLRTLPKSILPSFNSAEVAAKLQEDGWAQPFRVPPAQVDAIVEFVERSRQQSYDNAHLSCAAVRDLALDPQVVDVVRRYVGGEPSLYHSIIWRSKGLAADDPGHDTHLFRFHFDVADVKSLTLFVYLTDVDEQCGPHAVISGTHRRRSLWKTALLYIGDAEARRLYSDRINVILGGRGTAFFEEQTVYHRQDVPRKPRIMLRITYTLWRVPAAQPSELAPA